MINTELYKIFYYVSTHKNISKAAKALYISQPAISKSIKKLEGLTGCTLFLRSSKGVSLTSEGEVLYKYVHEAFKSIKSGERIIDQLKNLETGIVKIGISNTLCKYFFLPILEEYHQNHPNIKIQVINSSSPKTYSLLDEGKIDFGIISIPQKKLDYEYTELMSVNDVFVYSKKPSQSENTIPLKNLCDMPLMLLEKDNQTRIFIDQFLEDNNVSLTPEIEIGSMDFLIEFAKIGIGVACVIKEFVKDELENELLYMLPITPSPLSRKIGIVKKDSLPTSTAAQSFIDFLIVNKRL